MLKLNAQGQTVKVYQEIVTRESVVESREQIEERIKSAEIDLADAQADLVKWDELHPSSPVLPSEVQ